MLLQNLPIRWDGSRIDLNKSSVSPKVSTLSNSQNRDPRAGHGVKEIEHSDFLCRSFPST